MADNHDTPNREKLVQDFANMCNCSPEQVWYLQRVVFLLSRIVT